MTLTFNPGCVNTLPSTHKGAGPGELGPVEVDSPQLLLQDPAALRVGELQQEVPCLVQLSLTGLPLSHTLRRQLKKDKNSEDEAEDARVGVCDGRLNG